jgi:hypothetical protein
MSTTHGAVNGQVRIWLRVEGLLVLLLAAYLYGRAAGSWLLFGALFFVPDVSFAGYLAGPRAGAAFYNAAHSYAGPLVCALALLVVTPTAGRLPLVLIWAAHVGFDRALGYGLKYPTAFRDTHLGQIGRDHPERMRQ